MEKKQKNKYIVIIYSNDTINPTESFKQTINIPFIASKCKIKQLYFLYDNSTAQPFQLRSDLSREGVLCIFNDTTQTINPNISFYGRFPPNTYKFEIYDLANNNIWTGGTEFALTLEFSE